MGQSRKLWIPGPAGRLEAVLRDAETPRAAAVLAHPHPLHGGTMHNSVIFHSARALNRAGWTALVFNFRGVEASEGTHHGKGGEVADLAAAAGWLRGVVPRVPLYLAGFSFGAVCAIKLAVRDDSIAGVVAIGLATQYHAYDELARLGRPLAVVQAERDELADLETVRRLTAAANGRLHVIAETGHLFRGKARDAAREVVESAEEMRVNRAGPGPPGSAR